MINKEELFESAYQAALKNKEMLKRMPDCNEVEAAEIYGYSRALSGLITKFGLNGEYKAWKMRRGRKEHKTNEQ